MKIGRRYIFWFKLENWCYVFLNDFYKINRNWFEYEDCYLNWKFFDRLLINDIYWGITEKLMWSLIFLSILFNFLGSGGK